MKVATASGTTTTIAALVPPPGADDTGGYQNIKVWSVHASVTGGGAGTIDLQFRYTAEGPVPNTVGWRERRAAAAGVTQSFDVQFPKGWIFPHNEHTQFDIALTAPASSTNGQVNVTYEYTNEES